jgi:LuxR family maltose regulon positive regulatory protein
MIADGNLDGAVRWVGSRGLAADDEPAYPREHEYLVLARVLLAQQRPHHALQLLRRWRALAAAQGRVGSLISLRVLQVRAHAACDDHRATRCALIDALELAAPEGYLRVFVDEGEPLAGPLRELVTGKPPEHLPRSYLPWLAEAFARTGTPVLSTPRRGAMIVPGLVEPLTAREQQVLSLLAAGHPNRMVAERLVITVDTVKRHVSHLFEKLSVANRTQGVARARQLGVLP